jgi:hypothetical protein
MVIFVFSTVIVSEPEVSLRAGTLSRSDFGHKQQQHRQLQE